MDNGIQNLIDSTNLLQNTLLPNAQKSLKELKDQVANLPIEKRQIVIDMYEKVTGQKYAYWNIKYSIFLPS